MGKRCEALMLWAMVVYVYFGLLATSERIKCIGVSNQGPLTFVPAATGR